MINISYNELCQREKELLDAASEAMERAYAPYSNFFVGAALRVKNGKIIKGANYENAAYDSVCAERTALAAANSQGHRNDITKMAVIVRHRDFPVLEPATSCGACRQMLNEAAQLSNCDIILLFSNTEKTKIIKTSLRELFPCPFGTNNLSPSESGPDSKTPET